MIMAGSKTKNIILSAIISTVVAIAVLLLIWNYVFQKPRDLTDVLIIAFVVLLVNIIAQLYFSRK